MFNEIILLTIHLSFHLSLWISWKSSLHHYVSHLHFLIGQQLIVGLSTYFIANLIIDIAKNDDFLLNLAGFVLSLIIVYIPAYFATIYLENQNLTSLNHYVQKFTTTFFWQNCHAE